MDYKKTEQQGKDVAVIGITHFNLSQTLDCGQAFRWTETESGYTGIAHNRRLDLAIENNNFIIKNCTLEEFNSTWKHYFDLNRNYTALKTDLSTEEKLQAPLEFSPGLRLLNQDPWETLISYILSQNTNIPRIKKMISSLCEAFGTPLPCGGFTFPTPETLAKVYQKDLQPIKCGYRTKYIIDAANQVASGKFDIQTLQNSPTDVVRKSLLEICGVGPKVADCVLLYGFGRVECYPFDVWIKRITAELFPEGFPVNLAETAGLAQLFLFNYVRKS